MLKTVIYFTRYLYDFSFILGALANVPQRLTEQAVCMTKLQSLYRRTDKPQKADRAQSDFVNILFTTETNLSRGRQIVKIKMKMNLAIATR